MTNPYICVVEATFSFTHHFVYILYRVPTRQPYSDGVQHHGRPPRGTHPPDFPRDLFK